MTRALILEGDCTVLAFDRDGVMVRLFDGTLTTYQPSALRALTP